MFDLKVISSVLDQLEEERGIPKEKVIEAIEMALATAYKKEYGKKGQIIRSQFNPETGDAEFYQAKVVVDDDWVIQREDESAEDATPAKDRIPEGEEDKWTIFNPEQHLLLSDAKKMKSDVEAGEEMSFPLEDKEGYGRIASQTAKQVIIQKIREAEKSSVMDEYAGHVGEIVSGTVQRVERGNVFVDLGRANGLLPREEQIRGEHFRQGERVRAYLTNVEESQKGVFVRLSRSHPTFLEKLFEMETPELASGAIVAKGIAREPGSRSKIAVRASDDHIDPIGALVGQRGVRVSTVMSELGGEKIDIIEHSDDPSTFIEDALSPANVLDVEIDETNRHAIVNVAEDQQSLAIGKAGQNVRLAAKLTGWKIDIRSAAGDNIAEADSESVDIQKDPDVDATDADVTEAATEPTTQDEKVKESSEKPTNENENDTETADTEEEVTETAEEYAEKADETESSEEENAEPDQEEKEEEKEKEKKEESTSTNS